MRLSALLLGVALLLPAAAASAEAGSHTVGDGQTLGRIAKRYGISIETLCRANGITRREKIKPGQKLVIPSSDDASAAPAAATAKEAPAAEPDEKKPEANKPEANKPDEKKPSTPSLGGGMRLLNLPGGGKAYYFEPTGPGRNSLKPVIVYLHGRGGQPDADCRRWAPLVRRLGWLACPAGPTAHNAGRAWNNNWAAAHNLTMATIAGLREEYGRRIQLWGNTLVGFSEGAYAAMNVGVREPRTFNRWLILAANSTYWGGPGLDALQTARERVRRVYLITGEHDEVVDGTRQVETWLRRAGVTTRVATPSDMGHEVLLERKPFLYSEALRWLDSGPSSKSAAASAPSDSKTASR
jgi:LysM repeat protein/pimeloyl-ACP methyl ester carboxylesterase